MVEGWNADDCAEHARDIEDFHALTPEEGLRAATRPRRGHGPNDPEAARAAAAAGESSAIFHPSRPFAHVSGKDRFGVINGLGNDDAVDRLSAL